MTYVLMWFFFLRGKASGETKEVGEQGEGKPVSPGPRKSC